MASIFDWLELHSMDDEEVIRILTYSDFEIQRPDCDASLGSGLVLAMTPERVLTLMVQVWAAER